MIEYVQKNSTPERMRKIGEAMEEVLTSILAGSETVEQHKSLLSNLVIEEFFEKLPNKSKITKLCDNINEKFGNDAFASVKAITD